MKTINLRLSPDDAKIIDNNLQSLSLQLGYQINLSEFLRHILKTNTSKHSLYMLGYISYQQLHEKVKVQKGSKEINLRNRRLRK